MNNFDRIKAMSIEEFAKLLYQVAGCHYDGCYVCPLEKTINCEISGITDWLAQEVDDGEVHYAGAPDKGDLD